MAETSILDKITSDSNLVFDPETARAICRQCNAAADLVSELLTRASVLKDVGSAGNYASALNIQRSLSQLAEVFIEALTKLLRALRDAAEAVRQAGLRIVDQDEENAKHLRSTSDKARGYPALGKSNPTSLNCLPGDPARTTKSPVGSFPCNISIEGTPAGLIDLGYTMTQPAQPDLLRALGENWLSITRDLALVQEKFDTEITKLFRSGTWTGSASGAVENGLRDITTTSQKVVEQSFSNSTTISRWSSMAAATHSNFETWKQEQDTVRSSTGLLPFVGVGNLVQQAEAQQRLISLEKSARDFINSSYNPSVVSTA